MFSSDNVVAEIKRLVYTDGKTSGRTVIGTERGYLTEIASAELTSPEMYGRYFHFNTSYGADIEESDDLIIGSKKYSVQKVFHKKGCMLSFTRAIVIIDA